MPASRLEILSAVSQRRCLPLYQEKVEAFFLHSMPKTQDLSIGPVPAVRGSRDPLPEAAHW